MMGIRWLYALVIGVLLLQGGCVEPYTPELDNEDVNLLVVDGFLDATADIATVSLSRTLPVNSEDDIPDESGALVHVEDDEGLVYPLSETEPGLYTGSVPGAGSSHRYRLVIRTEAHREYTSEFVAIVTTPAIDSVTWNVDNGGVEFEVTTHDPTNDARYFRWKYVETYEYQASFNSLYKFERDEIVFRPPTESIFYCWKTDVSTNIVIGSTQHLKESVVNKTLITFIPGESIKLSTRYSLLVRQQALTEDAYNYWLNLEKSTEHLGGLFDPLPSEVNGNLRALTNPSETVIGYFSAGTVHESRIFVRRLELPRESLGRYLGDPGCMVDSVFLSEVDQIYPPTTLVVDGIYAPGAGLIGYTTAPISCADCRTLGGTTVRPAFWD